VASFRETARAGFKKKPLRKKFFRDARGRFTSKKKSVLDQLDDIFASEVSIEDSSVTREPRESPSGIDLGTWDVYRFELAESIDISAIGDLSEMAIRTMVEHYSGPARVRVEADEYDRRGRIVDNGTFTLTNSEQTRTAFSQVANKVEAMNPRASGAFGALRVFEFEVMVVRPSEPRKGKRKWKKPKKKKSRR
jgi:hypothetical protein